MSVMLNVRATAQYRSSDVMETGCRGITLENHWLQDCTPGQERESECRVALD